MTIRKKTIRPPKQVDPEVLRKTVNRAMLTLRKAVISAMGQKLIACSQSSSLNQQLSALDSALEGAFPPAARKADESWRLPF
jgi:hypothetical protein